VEGSCEHGNEPSGSIKCWEVLEWLHNWQLLKKGSALWVSNVVLAYRAPLTKYMENSTRTWLLYKSNVVTFARADLYFKYMVIIGRSGFIKISSENEADVCQFWAAYALDCQVIFTSSGLIDFSLHRNLPLAFVLVSARVVGL
jgi:hypothetical protein